MATTFGLLNSTPPGELDEDSEGATYTAVAMRTFGGAYWLYPFSEIAHAFADETAVYPLDNSAQGIETIGDLKREMQIKDS